MLRKLTLFSVVAMLVCANVHAAPDRTGKFDAGVAVAANLPDNGEIDDAAYVGGTLAYGINQWLAIGLESGWTESEVKEEDNQALLGFTEVGDLTSVPLLFDILLRVPIQEQPLVPYGVVGLGVIFRDFDTSSRLEARNIGQDVDSSFGVNVKAGIDWFINDNWIINFETGYLFSDADSTSTVAGVATTVETNADIFFIGAGVKYVFG